ncbi:MAG: DUF5694 domain-containing protein [Pseudomonadota bacterium]|nr:DUF5694 domain-containing protein [Pseudomonadota bacterium]
MRLPAILALFMSLAGAAPAAAAEPVQVMVLGTYHFDNPGLDLNNMKADDVTLPKRQAELQALANALAAFKPTKIMVEARSKSADLADARFASFTPAALRTQKNETVQIGYRLAHQLKLGNVYAIDEQPGPGEPDYFPFGKVVEFAKANKREAQLQELMAKGAAVTKGMEEMQKRMTIAQLLVERNRPDAAPKEMAMYYEVLGMGDTEQQPGADLNAMWYLRNAKIFAKLMTVAAPGDRILVIYGAGHNYWLRHFASMTPGFRSVDPVPYLQSASR